MGSCWAQGTGPKGRIWAVGGRHQPGPNEERGNRIGNHLGPRELGETQVVRAPRSRLVARWQRAPLEAGDAGEDPSSSLKPGLWRLGHLQTPLARIRSPGPALALLPPNCTRGRGTKPRQQLLGGHGGLGQVMTQQCLSPLMWESSYGHLAYFQEFRGSPLGSVVRACLRVAPSVDGGWLPPPPGQRKDRP